MKSTVYGTVNKKVYTLGYKSDMEYSNHWFNSNVGKRLNVHNECDDKGEVKSEVIFVEYIELYETIKFKNLLVVGDLVVHGLNEYKIIKIAYEENGDVRYYTDFVETYEDSQSKTIAEDEYAKRQVYLRGVSDGVVKEYNRRMGQRVAANYGMATVTPEGNGYRVLSVDNDNPYKLQKIKWYNFWKN